MELTASFIDLLQHFVPVFTTPTFQTFLQVVTGWVVSHRHRYLTEVIFAGGNVGNGHWCRFHRFFSHAAWDLDTFALFLAKLVVTILAAGATLFWAVDDTLCRKRGLTLYGAGMHYDPLISSLRQVSGQLGTRLGCALPDHREALLGAHESLRLTDRRAALPQSSRTHQGEEGAGQSVQARSQSSHSPPTGPRTHSVGGAVVPRRRDHPHR